MQTIHQLSADLIAKIAAGEVIERPVYAVKELIENSLDAGATAITIHLQDCGLKKITIHDNGIGMSREDILTSYQLHTTSKIQSIEELIGIRSLGFRGEALASLVAMGTVEIQSKTKDTTTGYYIHVEQGQITNQHPIGMPNGTTISVSNLFASVPARLQFLKSKKN